MSLIEMRGLRKDFTVRVKAGRFRRGKRTVSAVDGVDLSIDSGELGSAFTYGGRDFASYPVPVYSGWFRAVFAYARGFGFVAYQPALALLGRADPLGLPAWAGFISPVVALVAAGAAAVVWRAGIRHYRSTGS